MTDELISTAEAARLEGVSEVAYFKRRLRGTGPKAYPGRGRRKFEYRRSEVIAFAREQKDPLERIRDLERRLDVLESRP